MNASVRAAGTLDLTVHRRDPDVKPTSRVDYATTRRIRSIVQVAAEHTGHNGRTVCGKTLELDELWTDYEPEDRDKLCRRCFPDGA